MNEWVIFYKEGERLSGGHKTLSAAVLNLAKMQIAITILSGDNSLPFRVVIDHVSCGKRDHLNFNRLNSFGLD